LVVRHRKGLKSWTFETGLIGAALVAFFGPSQRESAVGKSQKPGLLFVEQLMESELRSIYRSIKCPKSDEPRERTQLVEGKTI
jgi:hypothetical protein